MEIHLPEDPAVPLLGIDQKVAPLCYRGICSIMSIAALFMKARGWKHPHVSQQKSIQKICLTYAMECYSAVKNEDIMSFSGKWIELENIILSRVTQTQKDKHGMYFFVCGY